MPSDIFRQRPEEGDNKASGTPRCLLRPDVRTVLDNFDSLTTKDARKAFADRWLSLIAGRLDDTWVAVYELCALVRDEELYRNAGALGRGKTFDTFEAYFEDLFGKPFSVWVELEATYRFATASCPALKAGTFQAAVEARTAGDRVAAAAAATTGEVLPHGGDRKGEGSSNNLLLDSASNRAAERGVHPNTQRKLDRLARERPDLLEFVKAGELSANRASIMAGFVKVPTPLEQAQRAYARLSDAEQQAFRAWLDEQ